MSNFEEEAEFEEATEILYKPPGKNKHYQLDKVLDDIYQRLDSIENQLNSIFNLK